MPAVLRWLPLALLLLPLPGGAGAQQRLDADLPEHEAADPGAAVVTPETLPDHERFWPYRVELLEAWQPPGRGVPLKAGVQGVLVRVEDSEVARIDFGRDGRHEVPIGHTDVVERANQVRRGERDKVAPNLTFAIGPRLATAESMVIRRVDFDETFAARGFLTVFAAPEDLEDLAPALAPLHGRHGVWTVVLPQGRFDDRKIWSRLRSLEWPVPFVLDYLAEGYTRSLLGEETPLPAVMLQSAEGRVVYRSAWGPDVPRDLAAALEEAFAGPAEPDARTAGQERRAAAADPARAAGGGAAGPRAR